jgi:hypothetical protein
MLPEDFIEFDRFFQSLLHASFKQISRFDNGGRRLLKWYGPAGSTDVLRASVEEKYREENIPGRALRLSQMDMSKWYWSTWTYCFERNSRRASVRALSIFMRNK